MGDDGTFLVTPLNSTRVRRHRDGRFSVELDDDERRLIATLAREIGRAVTALDSSNSLVPDALHRLVPTAYPADVDAELHFMSTTRGDLLSHHRDVLESLASCETETRLTTDELEKWLTGLNDLRLVIGTSLGVTESSDIVATDDPRYGEWLCYSYLSYLATEIVDALSACLPPTSPDADTAIPDDPWGEPLGGLRWDGTPVPDAD